MFVYLSKRIAIPSGGSIISLCWNEEQGWLSCGGESGFLKVLKVDGGAHGQKTGGLSVNQTLEGHDKTVCIVDWNQIYCKLTSCDVGGRIIVWTLHKGMWFEEMVNNRNKSRVVDLAWSADGRKICIAYEDGAIIVGNVDGSRMWGREYAYELSKVCWSPDDRYLLFGTATGEVYVHDAIGGQYMSQINIQCEKLPSKLAGLYWNPAWVERPEPLATLSICYASGKIQLMESIRDDKIHIIDANINVEYLSWNPREPIFVVCGVSASSAASSSVVARFFNCEGIHLRTLRVTGSNCGGISWEGDGLRVAIAVDSSVYFANVRPQYKYCYFKKTLVFSYNPHNKIGDSVMFWNVSTNARTVKYVPKLLSIKSCRDVCAIVSQPDLKQTQFMVQLLNEIGSPIGTQFTDLELYMCEMNSSFVVCCGEECIYLWQFRDPNAIVDDLDPISMQACRSESYQRIFHVDDVIRTDTVPTMVPRSAITNDLICAMCMNESHLFVGRESGTVHIYSLNPLQLVIKLLLSSRPHLMSINCNTTTLLVVDLGSVLHAFPVEKEKPSLVSRKAEPYPDLERKDIWEVQWAADDPEVFAVMEKTRMYVFKGLKPEEPVQSCANLCKFRSLKVRAVQFYELMLDPERPHKEYIVDFETTLLQEMREKVRVDTLKNIYAFVNGHSHPKLWSIFAEQALLQSDHAFAEIAFAKNKDYAGIQFLNRIRSMDTQKQIAEVHAYYHRINEAEKIYCEMDRKDLALDLRYRIGDWFGVVRFVQEGGGDEVLMMKAWENIGDEYANHQKWTKAAQYYTQSRSYRKLAKIFYLVEDYEMLAQLVNMVEHDKGLLVELGRMLLSMCMAKEASKAFIAAGETRMAVDGCVELNMWELAITLAESNKLSDVGKLLDKYAHHLIKHERLPEAIELFRKAAKHDQAAKLLAQLGQRAAKTDVLKAKKFHVLSALEVEKYRKKKIGLEKDGIEVVDELLQTDYSGASERVLDNAWRGAEAYHFFLLCQRHILERNSDTALVVAMRLMEYDDLIAPVDSYSLIALSSYLASNFGVCSRAFTRLEMTECKDMEAGEKGVLSTNFSLDLDITQKSLTNTALATTMGAGTLGETTASASLARTSVLSGTTVQNTNNNTDGANTISYTYPTVSLVEPTRRFSNLAIQIFMQHRPMDTSIDSVACSKCGVFNKEWASMCVKCHLKFDTCIVTGRCITPTQDSWSCHTCHRKALEGEIERFKNCPLCHTPRKQRARRTA